MSPKSRILVVDDNQHLTRTLTDILNIAGYEAVTAISGAKALEKAAVEHFDCVLTDVRMPSMNGVEFYRLLRRERPGLPVLLMTAYAADEIIRQGVDEGVVGVLDKPLNIPRLMEFFDALSSRRLIAIIDDDPDFCRTIADVLTRCGFSVAIIMDPHTAVEVMTREAQAVILDMKLNSIGGLDVLRRIRAICPSLPVLLITGYRQEMAASIQAALEISASACLYKPLEIPDLLEKLACFQLERLRSALTGRQGV